MCLVINEIKHKKNTFGSFKPKVAKTDIFYYKDMVYKNENKGCSPLYYFIWNKGKINKSKLKQNGRIVHEGFHAISSRYSANALIKIPKGAKYFIGHDEIEIVTNKMIFVKWLKE